MKMKDYIEKIYNQNVEMGWWDSPRRERTMFMLMISEVAEAMEGARKGIKDDHLPHRDMMEVELADTFIRCCDFIGREQSSEGGCTGREFDAEDMWQRYDRMTIDDDQGVQLYDIVESLVSTRRCEIPWEHTIAEIIAVAKKNNYNLFAAVDEKLDYNRNRADHKKENRNKEGGKKW